jgi:hypothetical protein
MVAQVAAAELRMQAQSQGREPAQFGARIAQQRGAGAMSGEGADAIQQGTHAHAARGRTLQRRGDLLAHVVVAQDEDLDVDA